MGTTGGISHPTLRGHGTHGKKSLGRDMKVLEREAVAGESIMEKMTGGPETRGGICREHLEPWKHEEPQGIVSSPLAGTEKKKKLQALRTAHSNASTIRLISPELGKLGNQGVTGWKDIGPTNTLKDDLKGRFGPLLARTLGQTT